MGSIKHRLTLSLTLGAIVVLVLAGFALHATMARSLVGSFDETSLSKARAVGVLLEFNGEAIEFEWEPWMSPVFEGEDEDEYFELYSDGLRDADGNPIGYRSSTLGELDLPLRGGPPGSPEIWDLELPDGRAGRAIGVHLRANAADEALDWPEEELPGVTVVLARSREGLDALLESSMFSLLAALGTALALMVWGARILVAGGLEPLGRLAREVEAIDAASLSNRITTDGVPVELQPLAIKVNELCGRLDAAFARQGRMTAAMAHELRTPIAELRTTAEVAQRWPEDEPMAREVVDTAADVALRMSDAVEAVMRYCRMEAGVSEAELEAIPLRSFLDEHWEAHARVADRGDLAFENAVPEQALIRSDRGLLSIVVGNLLQNAVSFASDGPVRASLDSGILCLTNPTDQLSHDDLEHLSEPFWRKDGARSNGRHSGLGLTLVKSVSRVLGHRAEFALVEGRFSVALELSVA